MKHVFAAMAVIPVWTVARQMQRLVLIGLMVFASPGVATPTGSATGPISHVWVIVEENHDWSAVKGNPDLPYINSLLAVGASAENYHNVPVGDTLHPSGPNYIVMEAGQPLGLLSDESPSAAYSSDSTDHLVTYLDNAGLDWRSYQEDIPGDACPLEHVGDYAPRHNPMVYFHDVTDGNDPASATCIAHVRPFDEMSADLSSNEVAAYNFITPNLCNDMHDGGCEPQADAWLATVVPEIMSSAAYQEGGVIFITWDEGSHGNEPIGMIVLSPMAKEGYTNTIPYTHASLLRTVQTIFGVTPYLGAADTATDLGDLFVEGTFGP